MENLVPYLENYKNEASVLIQTRLCLLVNKMTWLLVQSIEEKCDHTPQTIEPLQHGVPNIPRFHLIQFLSQNDTLKTFCR